MKILSCLAIIIVILFGSAFTVFAQGNTTNFGTEFWATYMDHIDGAGENRSEMDLYITSNVTTKGTVSIPDGSFSQNFTVTANTVTTITIPSTAFLGDLEGKLYKGIHITSVKPIAIYAHIFAQSVSGATLLLPVKALGKDYYSINYTQLSNSLSVKSEGVPSYSVLDVIATEDNTTVEVTPSVDLLNGYKAGNSFTVSLRKGEVYQFLSAYDLTGTHVRSISTTNGSCTKIAVFSGSSKISIACSTINNTSDNLFQQVYPIASWGKNYITAPFASRHYDIYRIVLSASNTAVKLNGALLPGGLLAGGYYEFKSTQPNVISADKPIQVVQYAVSQYQKLNCDTTRDNDAGDPEMIYITPIEQTIDRVTLFSTNNYRILNNYINVIIKTNAVKTFTIDGVAYTNFTLLPQDPSYSYAQIDVYPGPHSIRAADGFNAIAYGFGELESYGYAAGTNLQNLNEFIALDNEVTGVTQANGCAGVNYKLQLTLPYQTTNIKWDFKDGTSPYIDASPVYKKTVVRGTTTLYVYEYPKALNYAAGDYTVTATVFNPIGYDCGSNEDVDFDYNISDEPKAQFEVLSNCMGDSTLFKDISDAGSNAIKTWLWDFGDGSASVVQNPEHLYAKKGDYLVHLIVNNENDCSANETQTVHISSKPVASFKYSVPDCAGNDILFTDQSAGDEPIVKWVWDYGDGTPLETRTDNKPFNHIYQTVGPVTVKLSVSLANSCTSDIYPQDITISPLPVVDFALPDVCVHDSYAYFTDKSSIPDHTENGFTYSWNFGDANATVGNLNISNEKNPRHHYTQAANYQVTLTITSKYGCVYSKTQTFTVNGADPKAGFRVENPGSLCSSDDVIFDDASTVDFGSITRIVWYFDYNNNPADSVVVTKAQMPADRRYYHNYGLFNSSSTRNYAVVMKAYSGQSCFDITVQPATVTIKGNPLINISQVNSICQDANPIQIAEDKNGFIGTGVFSGPGVSSSGMFEPAMAGPGAATINYTFTAQNGCNYSTSQQINVIASPLVSFNGDLIVLEGSQTTLKPNISGTGLSYKWVPAIGLDHDDVLNPQASPIEDMRYTLTVTSDQGCIGSAQIILRVLKYPVIPNAFTPNNDGINDVWNIKYLNTYPNNTVDIYNRYGEKLYSSIGYAVPWDGRYKGADLPSGTYYYIINPKNGRKIISGSVTIIR